MLGEDYVAAAGAIVVGLCHVSREGIADVLFLGLGVGACHFGWRLDFAVVEVKAKTVNWMQDCSFQSSKCATNLEEYFMCPRKRKGGFVCIVVAGGLLSETFWGKSPNFGTPEG